jgi:hypothetical protein
LFCQPIKTIGHRCVAAGSSTVESLVSFRLLVQLAAVAQICITVQECDATMFDSSNVAGDIIKKLFKKTVALSLQKNKY